MFLTPRRCFGSGSARMDCMPSSPFPCTWTTRPEIPETLTRASDRFHSGVGVGSGSGHFCARLGSDSLCGENEFLSVSEAVSNAGQPSKIPSQRVLWDNATAVLGPYGCWPRLRLAPGRGAAFPAAQDTIPRVQHPG